MGQLCQKHYTNSDDQRIQYKSAENSLNAHTQHTDIVAVEQFQEMLWNGVHAFTFGRWCGVCVCVLSMRLSIRESLGQFVMRWMSITMPYNNNQWFGNTQLLNVSIWNRDAGKFALQITWCLLWKFPDCFFAHWLWCFTIREEQHWAKTELNRW